jgi:nucleotidyltransferase substrate binding protein (TIGR01987 family)
MPDTEEIRWQQRFANYQKAFLQLELAVKQASYNDLEEEGMIQRFEYCFELAWKTLQDLLEYKGYLDIRGARPVLEQSFQDGYISKGEEWLKMLKNRNLSTHTYNKKIAAELIKTIKNKYFKLFQDLAVKLQAEL